MTLPKFDKSELVFDQEEARAILGYFFGTGALPSVGAITDNDRSFAQGLLAEAVQASKAIGWIESLWKASVAPTTLRSFLLKMLRSKAVRNWLGEKITDSDIRDAPIYQVVVFVVVRNWRSAWRLRLITGDNVY